MEKVLLTRERFSELLGELCERLGYCLSAPAHIRIENSPPRTVDRFTDVVMRADGDDPRTIPKIRQEVREVVERHFAAAQRALDESPPP